MTKAHHAIMKGWEAVSAFRDFARNFDREDPDQREIIDELLSHVAGTTTNLLAIRHAKLRLTDGVEVEVEPKGSSLMIALLTVNPIHEAKPTT